MEKTIEFFKQKVALLHFESICNNDEDILNLSEKYLSKADLEHFEELLENRFEIDANYKLGYIAVYDHEKKVGLYSSGEDANELLEKCEELGENTDFIDWLYDNGYNLTMNEHHYHNR